MGVQVRAASDTSLENDVAEIRTLPDCLKVASLPTAINWGALGTKNAYTLAFSGSDPQRSQLSPVEHPTASRLRGGHHAVACFCYNRYHAINPELVQLV